MAKNDKQQALIETLNRDISIHKEVEKELAKRSHFCQKVIKRLKEENKDLQAKLDGKDTSARDSKGG